MPATRTALIALSSNQYLQNALPRFPASRRVARRFVAGEGLEDAIVAVRALNARGLCGSLDHLGENVTSEAEAAAARDEYLRALATIKAAALDCHVSLKLTQMGLDLDEELCYENMCRILHEAAELGNFVRIDMEGSAYVERTIALYRRLCLAYQNVGIVIQAYLRRSQADVDRLVADGVGRLRLCKGAYDEPPAIAYRARERVTRSLQELACTALAPGARERGAYPGIASHDEAVINFVRAYAYQWGIPPSAYEFQMLYGIRRELQASLARKGYKVRIYVPYGTHWYPYLMRRLAERPANLAFFLRALFGD
jgi:proline dehydrogenase